MKTISPHKKKAVAESYAMTSNQSETARQLGINKSTVGRIIKRDDVREMIELEREQFLFSLPNARENIQYLINNYLKKDDSGAPLLSIKEKDQAWKSSMEVLRAAGMLPSHSGSVHIENLYQQNNTQILSPIIQKLLEGQREMIENVMEGEVEDVQETQKE